MIILGIETSCDETALSLIAAGSPARMNPSTSPPRAGATGHSADGEITIRVLADKTLSQIELHKQYGGVFPNLAKREHSKNLIPLFDEALHAAHLSRRAPSIYFSILQNTEIRKLLEREQDLHRAFVEYIPTIGKPNIDAIAVTHGPGLEPCLWTGVNFAKALAFVWDIPVIPVNHMEGHIFSSLLRRKNMETNNYSLLTINFPALALLISGGHTELVLIKKQFDYKIIGQTRDDAVGEAFDKVARLLGLPYPGGPPLSALAERARTNADSTQTDAEKGQAVQGLALDTRLSLVKLPRPMLHNNDFDFSFSGLKTAALYLLKKIGAPDVKFGSSVGVSQRPVNASQRLRMQVAKEFEDAVTEVLVTKTKKALEYYGAKTLLIGGGVIANTHIRRSFEDLANTYDRKYLLNGEFLHIPEPNLTTDNALMIAVAGFLRLTLKDGSTKARRENMVPKGNLRLDEK